MRASAKLIRHSNTQSLIDTFSHIKICTHSLWMSVFIGAVFLSAFSTVLVKHMSRNLWQENTQLQIQMLDQTRLHKQLSFSLEAQLSANNLADHQASLHMKYPSKTKTLALIDA